MSENPREYWLDFGSRIDVECLALPNPPSITSKNITVHVVEYSALEKMRRDWAEAEKRLNDKYIDMLMERNDQALNVLRSALKVNRAAVTVLMDEMIKIAQTYKIKLAENAASKALIILNGRQSPEEKPSGET